jgi:hypothetical protein
MLLQNLFSACLCSRQHGHLLSGNHKFKRDEDKIVVLPERQGESAADGCGEEDGALW